MSNNQCDNLIRETKASIKALRAMSDVLVKAGMPRRKKSPSFKDWDEMFKDVMGKNF